MGTLVGAPDVVGCIHVCVCLLTCFFVCLFMSGHVSLRASCFWGCVVALGEDGVGSVSCLHVFLHLPDSCVICVFVRCNSGYVLVMAPKAPSAQSAAAKGEVVRRQARIVMHQTLLETKGPTSSTASRGKTT